VTARNQAACARGRALSAEIDQIRRSWPGGLRLTARGVLAALSRRPHPSLRTVQLHLRVLGAPRR
jgi:hypothetical protein